MYTLTMNDGTVLSVNLCGAAEGFLWLGVLNRTLAECKSLFMDPSRTPRMVYDFTAGKTIFEGYTEFVTARQDDVTVRVCMKRNEEATGHGADEQSN